MKYRAIIMAPQIVEFESEGSRDNVSRHAYRLSNNNSNVVTPEGTFGPRLLAVFPEAEDTPVPPLVFDPPPMAA